MFMQFRGNLHWQCPGCLWINRHRIWPLQYKVKCVNKDCCRIWTIGSVLYSNIGGSGRAAPPDLIPLDGGIYRNGRIHKVLCDSCSAVLAEHMPPPVARWPSIHRRKSNHNDGFADPIIEEEEKGEQDGISESS